MRPAPYPLPLPSPSAHFICIFFSLLSFARRPRTCPLNQPAEAHAALRLVVALASLPVSREYESLAGNRIGIAERATGQMPPPTPDKTGERWALL